MFRRARNGAGALWQKVLTTKEYKTHVYVKKGIQPDDKAKLESRDGCRSCIFDNREQVRYKV